MPICHEPGIENAESAFFGEHVIDPATAVPRACLAHEFSIICSRFRGAIEKSIEYGLQPFSAGGVQHSGVGRKIEIADE